MTTLYAVIGLPPSSAGAVHFTFNEVAWMSVPSEMTLGELGASGGEKSIAVWAESVKLLKENDSLAKQ